MTMSRKNMHNVLISTKPYLYIFFGNSFGALIQLFILPVLTRIYSKEAFAVYGIIFSWSIIAHLLSTLRYDTPVLQSKKSTEVSSLNTFCLLGTVITSISTIVLFEFSFLDIDNSPSSLIFACIVSLSFAGYTFVELLCKNLIFHNRYKEVGIIRSLTTIITAAIQVAISFLFISGESLLFARLLALIIVLAMGYYFFKIKIPEFRLLCWRKKDNFAIWLKYKKFPLLDLPAGTLNYISGNLPYLYLPFFFGSTPELGLYALVMRVFDGPMNLARNSIKNVFHKTASERYINNSFPFSYLIRTIIFLFSLFIPFALTLVFFGEIVFATLFSDEWREAGNLAAFGAINVIAMLIRSPIQCALQIVNKQSITLSLELFDVLLKIIFTIVASLYSLDALFWLKGYFVLSTISNGLSITYSLIVIKRTNQ